MAELQGDAFWAHLRMLDLARRLRADLDNLADTSPEIAGAVAGVGVFLADQLEDTKAAEILRGERRSSFADRLLEARKVAL